MRFIPVFIWWIFWAVPFSLLGIICGQLHFVFWSAQHEFKRGYYWSMKRKLKQTPPTQQGELK